MRKTKIICTLGPASSDPVMIKDMMLAGMNVARLNLSHGSHAEHQDFINAIRVQREKLGLPVAIMIDLKGPEFRIKEFENGKIDLVNGAIFTLTTGSVVGNSSIVSVTYKDLPNIVSKGDTILLNDGRIELEVMSVNKFDIITKVKEGGELSNNKSINLPNIDVDMPFLTDIDKDDIKFAIENDVEFIALSFVRCAEDVQLVKKFINNNGGKDKNIKLISKIENQQGIKNINSIIDESDGIMVARGDLGVELDFKQIPVYQKAIIEKCLHASKTVIVATEMLDSMIEDSRPTRAEITDVANAVLDGASATMLSGETAAGKNVIKCIETMRDIIETCEKNFIIKTEIADIAGKQTSKAIAYACKTLADTVDTRAIVVVSLTGKSVYEVAGFKPQCPIIACTTSDKLYNQLALCWNVVPTKIDVCETTDELLEQSKKSALRTKLVQKGDTIIQTAGIPLGNVPTNLLKVETI